jgi:hypothetical protein
MNVCSSKLVEVDSGLIFHSVAHLIVFFDIVSGWNISTLRMLDYLDALPETHVRKLLNIFALLSVKKSLSTSTPSSISSSSAAASSAAAAAATCTNP